MKRFDRIYAIAVAALIILSAIPVLCQEQAQPAAPAPEAAAAAQPSQPKDMSLYGEVQSVDAAASIVKVQYYDYDADDEKTGDIVVNKDSKLENANSISDIKKSDWVDVTYTVVDGKNIAKVVTVEKEEEAPAAPSTADPQTEEYTGEE